MYFPASREQLSIISSKHPTPSIEEEPDRPVPSAASTPCPRFNDGQSYLGSSSPVRAMISDTSSVNSFQVSAAPAAHDSEESNTEPRTTELNRLHASLATLRENLAISTAMIKNLHTHNKIKEANNAADEKKLQKAREEGDQAMVNANSAIEAGNSSKRKILGGLCLILGVLVLYVVDCWYNGPEMSYILQKRREALGV